MTNKMSVLSSTKVLVCAYNTAMFELGVEVSLGDIGHVFAGLSLGGRSVAGRGSVRLPALSVKNLVDGRIVADEMDTVTVEYPAKVERYSVRAGDLLIAARGTRPKLAVVPAEFAGAVITATLIGIRLSTRVLPQVLAAFLRSAEGQAALLARVRSGTLQIALTPRDVAEIVVPVPPLDVQHRVAALIDAAEASVVAAEQAARLRREVAYQVALDTIARQRRENGVMTG